MESSPLGAPPSMTEISEAGGPAGNGESPTGILILSALHIVGGLVLFVAQALMLAKADQVRASLSSIGIPPAILIISVMFLAVLAMASGIGMWKGTRWGWWLGSFYYIYSIFRNGSALLTIVSLADELEGSSRGPGYYMFKHGMRIVIHGLILMYFYKRNVLRFFDLERVSKAKTIIIQVGICIAIAVMFSVAYRL